MSLNDKLFSIASSAVEKQRKTRDSRSAVSKGFDVATNKSYSNEDKKVAAKALREWENKTWKPKVEAKLKQELKARAPHLKPGSPKYNQTYESLFNKNYKDLQAAKAEAQQKIGTLRKPKQTQRELDNEYRTNESIRNDTVGVQAASHAARDTVSAVGGALATGTSRLLRAPLQLAADVGDNDDGGIFDRGAKALESYEDDISNNVYQAYGDIQQNGNFSQKLAVSAVEQVPALAASFGAAGVAAKGVQAVGAGAKATAAASYGVAGASMYPQAYLDGSDSTKDELENATSEQLASAERSQDIYKGMFDKNVKAGMSEDEAHAKARDQTISEIAEESGENVGLATLALSMMAPGVGSFTANRAAGGAVSQWGQKVFNKLAVKADASKVAGAAIPTAVGAGIVGLNVAEEGLQEGYTDLVAQQAAVDVGVKEEIDRAQSTEAVLMGGILGGLMGGGTYIGTRNSKLQQAQDGLKVAQQNYADIASTIPQLQEQITAVSPRSAEGQALITQLEQTKSALNAMASDAESRGIPRTSLARRAPRIDPSNSIDQEFDGQVDGATEIDEQGFDAALNPQGTPAAPVQPVVDSQPSEQELDAQDAQIAELIAEQQALDEAIDDDSAGKPVEESLAAAQAWYDDKRGENKQGLSGVVSRAAAKVEDAAFAEQQQVIAGTGATINDYIASRRAEQAQIDAEIAQVAADAKTERERQAAEQLKQKRDIERAEAEAEIAKRAELAQPYENEAFDTTVVGADGTPFNLARFWDSNMPAAIKAKAIADAFGGQVEQNVAKADWASLPEGVQKQLHQWMTGQLEAVRQRREAQIQPDQAVQEEQNKASISRQLNDSQVASGLTMPVRAEQAPAAPVETDAATQLTDENPTINIPAPVSDTSSVELNNKPSGRHAPTKTYGREPWAFIGENEYGMPIYQSQSGERITQKASGDFLGAETVNPETYKVDPKELAKEHYTVSEVAAARERYQKVQDQNKKQVISAPQQVDALPDGVYKSQPAARAAIKQQKLNPKEASIVKVDNGWELVESTPATRAQARVDSKNADRKEQEADQRSDDTAIPNNDVAIGKDGNAKWFGKQDKAQAFIDKKGISNTHEVVQAGKRFEIQPKAQTSGASKQTSQPTDVSIENRGPDTQELTATGKAKITGQAGWDGNIAKSRDLVRQLHEAGYLSKIETENAFTGGVYTLSEAAKLGLKRQDNPPPVKNIGDNITDKGGREHRLVSVNYNKSGGIDSVSTQYYSEADGKYKSIQERSLGDFWRMFGELDLSSTESEQVKATTAKKPKPLTDEQFAELTSSRTTPSTPTGEQSAPAKRAAAKKGVKENKVFGVAQQYYEPKQERLTVEPGDVKWRDSYSDTNAVIRQLVKKGYLEKSEFDNSNKEHSSLIELAIKGIKAEREAANIAPQATTEKTQNDVAPEPKGRFADNKLFTEDKVAAARARLKSKLTQVNSGLDPEILMDGMTLAGAYIESGVRKFGDYAKMMMSDVGPEIKPYLLTLWNGVRDYPGLDNEGMTNEVDSRAEFNKLMAETEQASEPTTPAKTKHPESIDVGNDKRLFVGENTEGEPIYEDKNGIRSKPEGNFMASEPVGINLGSEGPAYDVSRRADKFKTVEEISENNNDDTEAGTQDQAGAPEVRARGSDPQSGATPADSGDVATEQPTNDSATDEIASAGRPSVRGAGANVADEGSVPSQRNAEIGREGTGDTRTSNARAGKRATDSGTTSPAATKASATDLLIENPLEIVGGTPVQRFNKNREALELLQRLETESRQASPAEQKILAGYIGWGSFGQELFQGSWDHPKYKDEGVWKDRGEWLRETMGESAWKSAQRSITNAHYTDPPTVMAMWAMVERIGFTGGRVLEPSMGTGNFFSMMPAQVQSRSQLTGIELDEMTGSIAKQLFPQSNIQVMGYQESKTPDNFYDVVIGNYPFENTPVADRRYNKLNPMLHDYFFLKSMDQVRPGGLVISITSSGTMDKQNEGIRRELAKQADLVAAIRLPSGAFKDYAGTAVVTDIVILRKRAEKAAIVPEDATWVAVNDYVTPSGETIKLSQYYIDNPQNIIGTIDFGTGTTKFGAGMIVRRPDNMEERLQQAIDLVPENVMQADTTTDHLTYYANTTGERHGSLFSNDAGELMLARGDQMVKAQDVTSYEVKSKATTLDRETQIKDAIDLRQKFTALVDKERAGQEAETERKALKSAYNAFVKNHGSLRDSYALKYMDRVNDPFYYDLAALEQDDGKPAIIMSRSTTRGKAAIKNPSVRDAYVLARNNSVNPTLKEIAALTDKSEQEIRKELKDSGAVFEGPNGDIVPSDIYLSGNVRQKLREAEAALKDGNKAMKDNVASLKAVVPEDVPYFNIETKLGATWIPPEAYQDYIAHMLGKSDADNINVSFLSGRWKVKLGKGMNHAAEARTNYGTHHYHFSALVQAAFSNQVVRITRKIDGEEVYDHEATSEANERIAKIRGDFSEWLWSDPERRTDLEKEYNEARNAWATPKYDGSFLTFEGMALSLGKGEFNLREHQANAIWRAIVNRRSINAHEVGTGKTFTMGGIAIESRRYGIAKKPIIFAHNANSAAVAEEIRMMYPSARVLYVNNLEPKFRDIRLRQIANDDWDVIVMPHSLLDRMTLTEDTLMAMAADDIAALEQEFREAAEEDGENVSKINLDDDESIGKIRSTTAKELAKSRKRIIETIKKQAQQSSKANAVTFEDLGIDMILVDEVHEFKKPPIVTRMKMKGLNTSTSQRSIQMQFLTRYVRQMNNGGNVHTFTGTPITNTITEIYHQMRYVMETEMNEAAVSDWDGWFGSFATETQDVELSSAGDYEMVTRLAGFVNVPELRQMIGQYMDTVFAEDMPEMQPRKTESGKTMGDDLTDLERAHLLNGRTEGAKDRPYKKVINESADMTAEQKRIFAQVQEYAAEWRDADGKTRRKWMKDGDHRSPLIYGRLADTASFDARLLDPDLVGKEGQVPDDENSKTSRVIKNVRDIYDSHELASQVIFMDQGYGTKAKRSGGRNAQGEKNPDITVDIFSPVLDLVERLVQSGIPREQIAVVSGKTKKEERSRIAAAMNTGEIRVVIGSTQTLGVGVNMQRNLRAMHHMDAPYMPGELEQRNGRGQRQGNQWNTVLEYRYMTDRLDGKRWQILAVKQRFITAFMKAKGNARTIEGDAVEEESDILESFSEAAGDPRILQRVKLQKKQDQLNSKERLYTRGIADMRREIRTQTELAVNNQAALDAINPQAVEDALASQRDNFNVTIDGKTYDKRADATAALDEYIKKNVRLGDPLTKVGSYAGTPMSIVFKHGAPNPELVLTMGGQTFSGKGITGLESVMRNLPKQIEKKQASIEKSKATVEHLKKAVTQPFTQKAELERVGKQIKALEADLDLNPIPAPVWLRQGAPMDSEVFYGKQPFVVTGHQYSKDGYFVVAEDDKGSTTIPYLEAKDSVGMPLYDEQEFIAPEIVTKKDADSLTEEDRVPGTEEPKFSKTNPAKGLTGTTSQQVIGLLQNRFGKEAVAQLIKAGKLRVRTLNDFVGSNGRLLIPNDAEGFYHQGKVVLIADNLKSDTAVATLLHELGGHAGIQSMLSTQTYMGLMENFYDLVKSGNKYAVRAKQRAEASTYSASEARDEYIPYLITEYSQATERGGPLAVIKRFVNRVMAGVRAWVRDNTGVQLKITPNDITQLAERMVKRLAEQSMDSVTIAGMDNTAAMPQYSQESTNQTTTAAFKKWFGDSKVVDSNGKPLVVYHGTIKSFNEFNTTDFGALLGRGGYFTSNELEANSYSGGGTRIVPAYLSIENPYYVDSGLASVPSRQQMLKDGHDGVIYRDTDGSVKWAVAHKPTQIKSATNNIGTFDPSNPDIRFSRRYSNLGTDTSPTTAKEKAIDAAKQSAATALSSKFNLSLLLRRHLATPLHVGMLNPSFKTFFENVQSRIAYENNEAGRIQEYLPEIWDTKLMVGKRKKAIDKVSRALFDGTMADQVWTDPELEAKFNLDDKQKDMYRRARAAIDSSVLHMTVDTLSSLAKGTKLVNIHTINRLKLAGLTPIGHNLMIQQHMTDELKKLAQSGSITPAAEKRLQNQLDGVFDVMDSIAVKYDDLVEKGYAPLMRFGHYAVEVRDKSNNELDLFELYETKGQQRKAIKELKEKYDENDFEVGTGTLNPDAFKQFTGKGLSPETVQLFAAELGLDDDGAYQAYLKVAISNQSALKRLIHRKKVPGYSEDLPRVLSSFVMSNARYSGRALYNGEIENAIQKIEDGNLQGEAQNVFANMENPQEEFAGVRGLLFHYYMGFSTAFMVLNFTQPFTQTIPKLTAYVGAARAHRDMTQALGIITKYSGKATFEFGKKVTGNATPSWKGFEDHLPAWVKKEDYLRMTREGHLDPQNIWMIRGLERGKAGVISGLWGNLSRAAGWAAEVSETINRRGTMIAAFKVAQTMGDAKLKAEGFNSRYDFAVSIIQQTQGVYNKGNRSGLARGTGKLGQFGPLVMVFKQFSINYAEQMIRHGRDKEVKSIAVAMTWQFLLAGALGLPFTDDLRDIVEGLLYRLFGRATNLTAFLQDELGKDNADALMYGLLSEKTRFDMYGRSNMGNFIPGTDFARPKEGDWAEVIGASSGFFENFFTAGDMITKGQYKDAAVIAAPRYVRDAAAGIEIWNNGAYRNQKGDKVMDMDRTDAVIKGALQFNPASNAKQGRERSEKYHMKNMVLDKQNQFALQLTEALYQEDYDRVDELYNDMDAWNERNPEHFNVDIDKIEDSAERRLDKKDFTSEDRQKLPEQLDDYFTERE
jgi:N12 class adenine-specific DNA methylase/phospholipid N-methyltransferase